jgi:hypothetical protein
MPETADWGEMVLDAALGEDAFHFVGMGATDLGMFLAMPQLAAGFPALTAILARMLTHMRSFGASLPW